MNQALWIAGLAIVSVVVARAQPPAAPVHTTPEGVDVLPPGSGESMQGPRQPNTMVDLAVNVGRLLEQLGSQLEVLIGRLRTAGVIT